MANEEKPAAKAAPKKAAAPKVGRAPSAPKAETAAKPEAKKPAAKKTPSGATVTVTQTGSSIGRRKDQEGTLIGLGLNKRNRTSTLEDTPSVRGMIYKVRHLVKVEKAS